MKTERQVQPGMIVVQTVGGQLSKSTNWTLTQENWEICRIERSNWKWNFWAYKAQLVVAERPIEVTSETGGGVLVLRFTDANEGTIATAADRRILDYRGAQYTLEGWESPDTVVDGAGVQLLLLRWQLQALHQIEVMTPLPTEFVAVATAACLLHERPTD